MIHFTILIAWLSIGVSAINLYPFPNWVTDDIRIHANYGKHQFKSLPMSGLDVTMNDMGEFGLKWGAPFEGIGFGFNWMQQSVSQANGLDINQTMWSINAIKIRWHHPLIQDIHGTLSFFMSAGTFFGHYTVQTLSETSGIKAYKERHVSGYLGDVGVLYGYELNPDWHVYIQTLMQISMNETATSLIGVASADTMDISGTQVHLGTILSLK